LLDPLRIALTFSTNYNHTASDQCSSQTKQCDIDTGSQQGTFIFIFTWI